MTFVCRYFLVKLSHHNDTTSARGSKATIVVFGVLMVICGEHRLSGLLYFDEADSGPLWRATLPELGWAVEGDVLSLDHSSIAWALSFVVLDDRL